MSTDTDKRKKFIDLVYTEELSKLRNFIRGKINDSDRVDDLAQEVYVRLARAPELTTSGEIKAYTYRIAANLVNDFWREGQRRPADNYPSDDEVFERPTAELEKQISNTETISKIQTAIDQLPDQAKRIFWLNRYEGMTYSEIAKELDVSVSWVEKNMMKAIKACRDAIKEN